MTAFLKSAGERYAHELEGNLVTLDADPFVASIKL